jgi:hypothetical protein
VTGLSATGGGLLGLLRKTAGLPALLASELFFTSDRDLETLAMSDRMRQGSRGKGFNDPRLLRLTEPPGVNTNAAGAIRAADAATLGNGLVAIEVKVSDERVSAVPSVVRQPGGFVLDPGHTNPGGYGR